MYGNYLLTNSNHQQENATWQRREHTEALYDELKKTQPINIDNGQVTFCRHFKYLGSYISFSLTDNFDIKKQLTLASQSMGALKCIWNSPHLEIWSKYLLFREIPVNFLLWG
jgi:hypothetical protein